MAIFSLSHIPLEKFEAQTATDNQLACLIFILKCLDILQNAYANSKRTINKSSFDDHTQFHCTCLRIAFSVVINWISNITLISLAYECIKSHTHKYTYVQSAHERAWFIVVLLFWLLSLVCNCLFSFQF